MPLEWVSFVVCKLHSNIPYTKKSDTPFCVPESRVYEITIAHFNINQHTLRNLPICLTGTEICPPEHPAMSGDLVVVTAGMEDATGF